MPHNATENKAEGGRAKKPQDMLVGESHIALQSKRSSKRCVMLHTLQEKYMYVMPMQVYASKYKAEEGAGRQQGRHACEAEVMPTMSVSSSVCFQRKGNNTRQARHGRHAWPQAHGRREGGGRWREVG